MVGCITRVVIPSAGRGTRLRPLTRAVPKELLPLGSKPVLEHIVEECIATGLEEIVFVISRRKESIRLHFGNRIGNVRIFYAYQREQNGLADAIYCARNLLEGDSFAVALGDSVVTTDRSVLPFKRVLEAYGAGGAGAILVQRHPCHEVGRYGIVDPIDQAGSTFRIKAVVEKPQPDDAPSTYAIAGRYAFDPVIFEHIKRTPRGVNGEYQLSDSINLMIEGGHEVWCEALSEGEIRRDIGTFESYIEAFQHELTVRGKVN